MEKKMLRMHAHYQRIVQKAEESHAQNRNPFGIDCEDIMLARLYSYALRLHIIGTFHATRIALQECPLSRPEMKPYRTCTLETLEDLANQSMETVPRDFRVVITTFHRYHCGIIRVLEGLEREPASVTSKSASNRNSLSCGGVHDRRALSTTAGAAVKHHIAPSIG